MIIENLYVSDEAHCLTTRSTEMIGKAKFEPMRVSTPAGDSIIPMVRVTLRRLPGEYLADRNTGTLYCPNTGKCFSSGVRKVLGLAGELPKAEKPKYDFARRTTSSEIIVIEKAPAKQKLGRGKQCGEAKGMSKLTEEIVKSMRAKKDDGGYFITAKEAQSRFGISKSTVADVRSGKTWLHVK